MNEDSGVQRLLDARGQRGSWMASKIFSIRSAKFLTTFFYQLSNFRTIHSLDAPSRAVTTFFSSLFAIYLQLFYKNWPLGCPPGWMPGVVAPSAPPLHATELRRNLCVIRS